MLFTKGNGIMNTLFAGYFPKAEDVETNPHGSLVVHETGTTTAYALLKAQERGELFIGPGENVYEGQVIGQNGLLEVTQKASLPRKKGFGIPFAKKRRN